MFFFNYFLKWLFLYLLFWSLIWWRGFNVHFVQLELLKVLCSSLLVDTWWLMTFNNSLHGHDDRLMVFTFLGQWSTFVGNTFVWWRNITCHNSVNYSLLRVLIRKDTTMTKVLAYSAFCSCTLCCFVINIDF